MKKYVSWSVLCLAFFLASPANGRKEKTALQASPQAQGAATPEVNHEYVIGGEDVLDIDVMQQKDLSRTVAVRPDGKITLPLIQDVQAAGLTPSHLAAELANELKKYITNPQVTVIVVAINSKLVYLGGEINHPGAISLVRNMNVLQALFLAGGPTQYANRKAMYVLRMVNGKQVSYPFNYIQVMKGKKLKENITLQPGDTIVVP